MTDDAVEIVALKATIAQRDATIERLEEWNQLRGMDLMTLAEQIGKLREALKPFADWGAGLSPIWKDHEMHWNGVTVGHLRAASAAYDGTGEV